MSETDNAAAAAGTERPSATAEIGLDPGHLSRLQITSLAVTSFVPAVGMATAPFLFFGAGGFNAWPAALLAMVATVCVGKAIITFARRYVGSGSLYSYIGEVFGPWARYAVGASLLLGFITQVAGTGSLVGIYFGSFLTTLGLENGYSPGLQMLILAVTLTTAALIALRGLDTSVRVAVTLTLVSVPLMILVTGASATRTGLDLAQQFDFGSLTVSGTFQGMASGIAFLVAFESCTALAAETRDPKRNVPLAVMSTPVLLGLLYVVVTFLQVPGLAEAEDVLSAGASPVAALNAVAGMPSWIGGATDLVLAIATFAAVVGFTNYGSRYLVTLGVDGFLPARVTDVDRRRHTPAFAIVSLSVLGFLTMGAMVSYAGDFLTSYNTIAVVIVYCWVLPYVLIGVGAILVIAREKSFEPLTFISSFIAIGSMSWLFINGLIHPPGAPIDVMSRLVPFAIAVCTAAFAVSGRRATPRDDEHAAEMERPH
ncbi:APC family permease [Rhodococcus gordoniae]|uniref:APC family permease n=2 Tax=Nocardiaceae TaxID=85025 RepID=UPI00101FE4EA|nr:APC family permease [Rhodococcus gordoniae]UTT50915.1 APC family permease [Rhodococcus gordoniae]